MSAIKAAIKLAPCLVLAAGLEPAWGLAMRNTSAKWVLDGLEIGRSYELAQLIKGAMVVNTGTEGADVGMLVAPPDSAELEDGYEPLPDMRWIKLSAPRHRLLPGDKAKGQGVISLPEHTGLREGQYQAQWISKAESVSGLKLDLASRLLLRVSGDHRKIDEARRKAGKNRRAPVFRLGRKEDRIEGTALGHKVDLKARHKIALKVVNLGEHKAVFALSCELTEESAVREPFSPAPNPHFLKLGAEVVEVGPGKIGEAALFLQIPDQKRYAGRRWVFTVSIEVLGTAEPVVENYRLWVTTDKK